MALNKGLQALIASLVFIASGVLADTMTVDTEKIMEEAFEVGCMDYQVVGGCIWMTCTIYGCEYDYSVKVRHNVPEVMATAYPFMGKGPWEETAGIGSPSDWAEEGGASEEGGAFDREQALKFKNADIIGSPSTLLYHAAASASSALPICKPLTLPMIPYFVSAHDPYWRDPLAETVWTMRSLTKRIGTGGTTFAGLFPRIGFVRQGHDYKASFVAARRAEDLVRANSVHVAVPLDFLYDGDQGQWPPENDQEFAWQQMVPLVQSCRALPDIDDLMHVNDPYAARVNQVRGNAWQLWRPYECCNREGAVLIYDF